MALKLFNTKNRQVEEFQPIAPPVVGLYSCGPTVYDYAHLGNYRAFLLSDLLKRVLLAKNYQVKQVINITDVGHLTDDADSGEDKIELSAGRGGKTAATIIAFYTDAFMADLQALNFDLTATLFPRASEHLPEQIDLIKRLLDKGYVYQIDHDGLYFDTAQFPAYGQFSCLDLAGQQAGDRVANHRAKRQASDFAVWKFSPADKKRQQEWPSPWGVGFPGWHLECSAMSMKYLGETIDIHTGGIDHIPVHHTNEIAQAESVTGKEFVRFWLHSAFLKINDEKLSKSLGNFITLAELSKAGYSPLAFRYFILQTHYRQTANFTWEALAASATAYRRLLVSLRRLLAESRHDGRCLDASLSAQATDYLNRFWSVTDDDLNFPEALSVLWGMLGDDQLPAVDKLTLSKQFDQVLGLKLFAQIDYPELSQEILTLGHHRQQARQAKAWSQADHYRQQLADQGYELLDRDDGQTIVWPKID